MMDVRVVLSAYHNHLILQFSISVVRIFFAFILIILIIPVDAYAVDYID